MTCRHVVEPYEEPPVPLLTPPGLYLQRCHHEGCLFTAVVTNPLNGAGEGRADRAIAAHVIAVHLGWAKEA
jgi:hypothetical protein